MTTEVYFSIIIWILMGLTFIAISLIFLYMIYGEKEETSSSATKATKATNFILKRANRIPLFF